MVKLTNGIYKYITQLFSDLDFEMFYQSNINQLTVYIESEITRNEYKRLKAQISKYIGDNMLMDSYKTVKIFY